MASGDSSFAFKTLIFAMVIMVSLPVMINLFVPQMALDVDEDQLLDDYYRYTGNSKSTKESVWVLTGIYTPYGTDSSGNNTGMYGVTDDNWIYGSRVTYNRPTQYQDTPFDFDVTRDTKTGIYKYATNSADYSEPKETGTRPGTSGTVTTDEGTGHKAGDLYTYVTFDIAQKSDIFFNINMRHGQDGEYKDDEPFYYEYTGYRYAFQPTSSQLGKNADGETVNITATTTSLSLIWYSYYRSDGLSGQLVISGSDSGVAVLSSDEIIKAFDSTTSTAKFAMTFNGGIQMTIYLQINPYYLAQNMTVEQCYNAGYWSVMVTSQTTDLSAYNGSDSKLDVWELFETLIDLLTFDYTDYKMSDMMGAICSFVIVIPLYAGLISLAMGSWKSMAVVGVAGLVEAGVSAIKNLGWF